MPFFGFFIPGSLCLFPRSCPTVFGFTVPMWALDAVWVRWVRAWPVRDAWCLPVLAGLGFTLSCRFPFPCLWNLSIGPTAFVFMKLVYVGRGQGGARSGQVHSRNRSK